MKRKILKSMRVRMILAFIFLLAGVFAFLSAPQFLPLITLATTPIALDEETINKITESMNKVVLFKPELLTELKNQITEGFKNGFIEPVLEKIQAIADKIKIPEQQNAVNKKWYDSLLSDVEKTADDTEKNRLGFNRYGRLLYQHARGIIKPEDATILLGLRNTIGYANETTPAEGGFLIPEPTAKAIFDDLREQGIFWNKLSLVQMISNTLKYPALDAQYAPVPKRVGESENISVLKLIWKQVKFELQKYGFIIPWTDEFMQDSSVDLESVIRMNANTYFGIVYDNALFRGDEFILGIPGHDVTVKHLTTKTYSSLTGPEIIAGMHGLRAIDMVNAEWYMSNDVWGYLQTVPLNPDLDNSPMLLSELDVKNKMLRGYPVNISDSCLSTAELTNVADKPVLSFGNFKKIYGGYKNNLLIDVSNQATIIDESVEPAKTINLWQQDMWGIRIRHRADIKIPFPIRILQWKTAHE
jgi:HK97 family phage major capsid protein